MYIELKVGDRVTLKVEPRLTLTHSFKGPPIVQSYTKNNVVIQLQWYDSAEIIDVSLCDPEIDCSSPWMSNAGNYRKGGNYVRGDRNPMKLLLDRIMEEVKRWLELLQ